MIVELLTKRYPGMRAWLVQRLTALIMAIYSIMALTRILIVQPTEYVEWVGVFQPWWFQVASWLFWISLTVHAWLGIRDVLKDYVPDIKTRQVLIKIVIVLLWGYIAWATWLLLIKAL